MSVLTANEPALSPKMVTLLGSPPKRAILAAYPFERSDHIHQAIIARCATALPPQIFTGQKTENSHPVVDVHQHYAAIHERRVANSAARSFRQPHILHRGSKPLLAAGARGSPSRRVDIKVETILARPGILKNVIGPDGPLCAARGKIRGIAHALSNARAAAAPSSANRRRAAQRRVCREKLASGHRSRACRARCPARSSP